MSTIPQSTQPLPGLHLLTFAQWGWTIQLAKKEGTTALVISTPEKGSYSLEIDEEGNVVEHISGNYVRIVEGSVEERTFGATIVDSEGPVIVQSEKTTIISAPTVHLNPGSTKEE